MVRRSIESAEMASCCSVQNDLLTHSSIPAVYDHRPLSALRQHAAALEECNSEARRPMAVRDLRRALPIVLARFSPRGQSNPASELIRAHAYWRRCGRIADLVLLHDAAPADELHDQLERLGVLRQNLSTGDGAVSPRSMRLTQSRAPPDRVSVLAHGTVERVWTTPLGEASAHERPASRRTPGVK